MAEPDLSSYIAEAAAKLKDFQRATVDRVHDGLFERGQKSMLVADEVGLGKTIVAQGIIARCLERRVASKTRRPFRVTYVCSNQMIVQKNLQKLNPFPSKIYTRPPVSRLAFLALDDAPQSGEGRHQRLLELNSLTPGTSLDDSSTGLKEERAVIFGLLSQDTKMDNREEGLVWLLKASVQYKGKFRKLLRKYRKRRFREGLAKQYIEALKKMVVPLDRKEIYEHFRGGKSMSVYDAVVRFTDRIEGAEDERRMHYGCVALTRLLRKQLIRCCLGYVGADLYILDEFQRFSDLIDVDNDDERAALAQKIFRRSNARILLLSATPFKALAGRGELDDGEDPHRDFRRVLKFLFRDQPQHLEDYDRHRGALYRQLLGLRADALDVNPVHRDAAQRILGSVICRTERASVADEAALMIEDRWDPPLEVGPGDIENYRHTDRVARALESTGHSLGKPVDYCKSAPYPLSYLDHYQLKEQLRRCSDEPAVQAVLRRSKAAWLDLDAVHRYRFKPASGIGKEPVTNARLSMLVDTAIGDHGARLLWVPPSLPYYELGGAFAGAGGFTKTLVFSAWVMVPRMISTLLSYEAERRTIGDPRTRKPQEKGRRRFFASEQTKRHPAPQLRFPPGDKTQPKSMSNLTLLWPSPTLAGAFDPAGCVASETKSADLRGDLADRMRRRVNAAKLEQYAVSGGQSDRWYWAAPLLLDRMNPDAAASIDAWIGRKASRAWWHAISDRAKSEGSGKRQHWDHAVKCFTDPQLAGLGVPPDDLPEVLADLVLGSPAISALRSLNRTFAGADPIAQLDAASNVAGEFLDLFNKPEAIAAVRLSVDDEDYWRMALRYCADGCLQSVLDEFFHVLVDQNVDRDDAIEQLLGSINIRPSSINVDSLSSFRRDKPRKMRCHYAVEFGSQRIETESGQKRATNLQAVFNSPFRPFVLATTSIGQEGLDFHAYCRRVVHWNLPSNPIDLEQREGRVNRYKGLAIRQHIAEAYRNRLRFEGSNLDPWTGLFDAAHSEAREAGDKCELVPCWHIDRSRSKIERVIPLYPFSKEASRLSEMLKTLAIYRLAFGQPRQPELVEHLLRKDLSADQIEQVMQNLLVDLSPINAGSRPCQDGE